MDSRPVLLQLRLRGRIADPTTPESVAAIEVGHAVTRTEHLVLTAHGRIAADAAFELVDDARTAAAQAYEQFLRRNVELIRVCHDWQVRPGGVPNDHRDAGYDWSVVDRLGTVDDRIGPVVRRLGRTVESFDGYRPRLREARQRIESGEHDWFTSPRLDSYHTVWMEIHEHLLLGLGIERIDGSAETS